MSRELIKIKKRLDENEKQTQRNANEIQQLKLENAKMRRKIEENSRQIKEIKQVQVVELLQKKKPQTDDYLYTYRNIGDIVDLSTATISNIAKANDLSRKS